MDYYDSAGYKVEDMHYFDVHVPSVLEVWESCMRPSIVQIVQYMATFFLWNIAFRLTSQTGESFMPLSPIQYILIQNISICILLANKCSHSWHPAWFSAHCINRLRHGYLIFHIGLGLTIQSRIHNHHVLTICHNHTHEPETLRCNVDVFLLGVTYNWVCLPQHFYHAHGWDGQNTKQIYWFAQFVRIYFSEILDTDVSTWHRMRGTQMIAAMKIISIGFDIDLEKMKRAPDFLEFWGYVLCPGNVVMGPWASYNEYLLIYQRPKWVRSTLRNITRCSSKLIVFIFASHLQTLKWIFHIFCNAVLAIFFLLASNCLISGFIPDLSFTWVPIAMSLQLTQSH